MSIADWLPRPRELRELRRRADRGDYVVSKLPSVVAQTLQEQWYSSRDVDYMVRHANDFRLGGQTAAGIPDDSLRMASVGQCRHLYFFDPLFSRIINLWTDFGFGQTMELVASDREGDQSAQAAWDEYWTARRNAKIIGPQRRHVLSNRLLVDGEMFWTWFVDESTGLATVRFMTTDQVTEIVSPHGDPWVALYYAREWQPDPRSATTETWWYQDKDATADDLALIDETPEARPRGVRMASEQEEGVDVYASQFELATLGLRGWPLMTAGADWSTAYKTFAEDRVALTRAAAMFYRKLQVKGGSRDLSIVKSRLDSALRTSGTYLDTNPPPVAGSTLIMNQEAEEQQTPYSTGAGDADRDGAMLIAMAGIAAGVFPHYLGRGEAFRLATATSMETPVFRMWARYQNLWGQEMIEHFNFILDMRERYAGETYDDREATITMDPLREPDVAAVAQGLTALNQAELLPSEIATRLALEAFQVDDIETVLAQAFPESATAEQQTANLRVLGDLLREAVNGDDEDRRLAAEVGLEQVQSMLKRMGAKA